MKEILMKEIVMKFFYGIGYVLLATCIIPHYSFSNAGLVGPSIKGRLGDNLDAYYHNRWISFERNLDFYYREFNFSNKLAMHTIHSHRFADHTKKNIIRINDTQQIPSSEDIDENTLFFSTIRYPKNNQVDNDNQEFITIIREEMKPLEPTNELELPKDKLAVAVHIRRGGGVDRPLFQEDIIRTGSYWQSSSPTAVVTYEDVKYPRRFLPDTYYIQQLRYVLEQYPDKEIFAYIFTDDPSPHLIAQKYERMINNPRLTLGHRTSENSPNLNVLDDLFAMSKFEVLIRPRSSFSFIAGRLGRPKLEIWPEETRWEGKKLIVTKVGVMERDKDRMWTSQRYYLDTDK